MPETRSHKVFGDVDDDVDRMCVSKGFLWTADVVPWLSPDYPLVFHT